MNIAKKYAESYLNTEDPWAYHEGDKLVYVTKASNLGRTTSENMNWRYELDLDAQKFYRYDDDVMGLYSEGTQAVKDFDSFTFINFLSDMEISDL